MIGTVSASEFFVTVAAVLGFFGSSVGLADGAEPDAPPALRLELVAMLILGGVVAAPVAPLLVVRIAPRVLGQATHAHTTCHPGVGKLVRQSARTSPDPRWRRDRTAC